MSAVMPKSSMEKMAVCPAKKTSTKIATACPFLTQYDGVQAVPPFLGGGATCPPELIAPSDRAEGADPGGLTNIHIRARSRECISLDILQPDTIVQFSVGVSAHHIMLSAVLEPLPQGEQSSPARPGVAGAAGEGSSKDVLRKESRNVLRKESKRDVSSKRDVKEKRRSNRRWSLSPALKPQPVRDMDGILKGSWKISAPGKLHVTFDNG
jgi:hypothetical protein